MARGKSDDEMLALQRVVRMLDELEDPRSRARVAHFAYLRYTAAGEEIVPPEDRVVEIKPAPKPAPAPQVAVSTPDPNRPPVPVPTTTDPPVGAPDVPTRPGAATAPESGSEQAPGWDLSGRGSAHDDTPVPGAAGASAGAKKVRTPKIEASKDGKGWDLDTPLSAAKKSGELNPNDEVEVKI